MKIIDSDEVLEEILYNKNVVYGAGNYGRTLQKYLYSKYGHQIDSYAVSNTLNIEKEIDGIEVKSITEVPKENNLIIAISEQHQKELKDMANNLGFTKIYILLNEFVRYMQSQMIDERLKERKMLGFEVHITEHCNLNCKGCYHFSSLANEEYLKIEEFKADIFRIKEICGENVDRITLLGGEPLLHPDIEDFIICFRELFSNAKIEVLTNGILLLDMREDFWKTCSDNGVYLSCTKYPINVDYDAIEKKAREYNILFYFHNDVGAGEKTLIKYPFDIYGKQDPTVSFEKCTRANLCVTLKHGRLYPCPMAAHAHLAKDYFNIDLELSDQDSIDIYSAKCMNDIMQFLVKPIPFCRYCNLSKRPEQLKWGTTRKALNEWF